MEVVQVLHMNGGNGETSYAQNSVFQQKVISRSKLIIKEAMTNLYNRKFHEKLVIADFGCSSGPNTLFAVSEIIKIVENICKKMEHESPEYHVFLNDLSSNDFNFIFKSLLPAFEIEMKKHVKGPCFVSGTPGSFYGRLFPSNTLHFAYSSSGIHWLSQVPKAPESNKGNIYMSSSSPPSVLKAYCAQFGKDFSTFLKCRSDEIVGGGRMVLTFMGRRTKDPTSKECCYFWELLAMALNQLVQKGMIDEEKFDSFNIPIYTPSPLEVKYEIEKEGSFSVDTLEIYEQNWNECHIDSGVVKNEGYGVAKLIRAAMEPLIINHFGFANDIIDEIFDRYSKILNYCMAREKIECVYFILSITKKDE
ncbi:S-adenosyl-L-methionine:benzoic acid/salicylic acid carboxyl methyltransferase 3-like isoform X2 [Mercurialis annua]|uniref:S-adenosyl-L-methionine:benzoic acid/salicylic acid carboxyl methyltransferase 3-like isoform X1 n=1 Tax=Mercurialis annua TaxID=3986 RepID=UPI00215F0A5B|nr:S-adenosyl-L-methionine:benzoic acid/salicylic acid carboxyl methyltransferase 3-like isoform X1 [Mercurialis annua]XP_050208532.1 S-adenosyl-L-methionine:benzoic acid/salicylic acid carboxyl methyltransferase 3-like isoform X3 [Mercurialis annua]XP_050208533.1 S-adenosyl-L-methionine:benzoic acid/salicylic acid carboxyl methyltransferase 3-like isoform X2 [Mercurialis annua]